MSIALLHAMAMGKAIPTRTHARHEFELVDVINKPNAFNAPHPGGLLLVGNIACRRPKTLQRDPSNTWSRHVFGGKAQATSCSQVSQAEESNCSSQPSTFEPAVPSPAEH